MKMVPFCKYSSCGNNFVILDEISSKVLDEEDLSRFAYYATNQAFGVGADNLLVVQPANAGTLQAINDHRRYWTTAPGDLDCDFLFRMFEPSGEEALCCGNGLMCIAEHLGRVHGASYARLATEIPLATPNRVAIGSHGREGSWAQMGRPRSTPSSLFKPDGSVHRGEIVDHLQGMKVQFRAHDIKPYTDTSWLDFSAYLVFTGEPHLVIFPQWHFADLAEVIFNGPATDWGGHRSSERRSGFGDWLVERIGASINDRYRHLFPGGVNVNFVRLLGADLIEYRCYERGINRETLACGTGALAVAFVSGHLGKVEADDLQILPHLCRRFDGEASIKVYLSDQGGRIESSPRFLFDGLYRFPAPIHRQVIHRQDKSAMPALTQSDEFATNPYLAVAR